MDHITTEDLEDFDTLLEASSLGAPRVAQSLGAAPAGARRRFEDAARQPHLCVGPEGEQSESEAPTADVPATPSARSWLRQGPEVKAVLWLAPGSGKTRSHWQSRWQELVRAEPLLKSWALLSGASLNPGARRVGQHVEQAATELWSSRYQECLSVRELARIAGRLPGLNAHGRCALQDVLREQMAEVGWRQILRNGREQDPESAHRIAREAVGLDGRDQVCAVLREQLAHRTPRWGVLHDAVDVAPALLEGLRCAETESSNSPSNSRDFRLSVPGGSDRRAIILLHHHLRARWSQDRWQGLREPRNAGEWVPSILTGQAGSGKSALLGRWLLEGALSRDVPGSDGMAWRTAEATFDSFMRSQYGWKRALERSVRLASQLPDTRDGSAASARLAVWLLCLAEQRPELAPWPSPAAWTVTSVGSSRSRRSAGRTLSSPWWNQGTPAEANPREVSEKQVVRMELPGRFHRSRSGTFTLPLQVRLTFCGTDPVAVQAVFQIQGKETSWTFGRDLLVEGIRSKVGDGDVSVWPETPEVGDARLYLELRPPEGRCVVSLPRPQVKEFLEQAMHIVPRSAEERYVRSGLTELEMHLNQAGTFSGRKDS